MTTPRFPGPASASSAIAWALLSQTIWLPLIAIDLHDQWQARLREQREIAAAAARVQPPAAMALARSGEPIGRKRGTTTGLLLGASGQGLNTASQSLEDAAQRASARSAEISASQPSQPSPAFGAPAVQSRMTPLPLRPFESRPAGVLAAGFKRSELLGGSLTLEDLHKPPMPSLAMAEQARWANSADPLAPLPIIWREPMRKALSALAAENAAAASIRTARVIHIPSSRIKASTTVPLAIQGDGSVDILGRADDPRVVDEIRHWSKSQPSAGRSGVTAALVHLEPLPAPTPVLTPNLPAEAAPQPQTRLESTSASAARASVSAPASEPPPAPQAPAAQATAAEPAAPAAPVAPLPPAAP